MRGSILRGNLRSAINQLRAFQEWVQVRVAPLEPFAAAEFTQRAQDLIGLLDPTGARRTDLDALAGAPLRVLRLTPSAAGALSLEAGAVPGVSCVVERSPDLLDWTAAGNAVEVDDGRFEFIDPPIPGRPSRFYRLRSP